MAQSHFLYNGNITGVVFQLSGTAAAKNDSYVTITSYDQFQNNQPFPGGVYDAHTGTTDHSYKCQTCCNGKRACIGHEGCLQLNYPVWNPLSASECKKWLKIICFECGKIVLEDDVVKNSPVAKRFEEVLKATKSSVKKCAHCGTLHPMIKKNPAEPLSVITDYGDEKRQNNKSILYPHKISEYLNKIQDSTVAKLGKNVDCHPRNFILWAIKVPSVSIRPDVKKMGGGRSTNDDLTTMLQIIIKRNDSLPAIIPDTFDPKLEKAIFEFNNSYHDFIKAGGENAMNSVSMRLKGKMGRFRKNQLGKRTILMCRSTIVGDPRIEIDEVGVPLVFARIIQYKEVVQDYNKKILLGYIQNGQKKYPGATKIIKKVSGAEYDVDGLKEIDLECGDIVFRDMIDGDPMGFNRQPSLMASNISTHRAKVILDPAIKTLLMNVIATSLYNADFDGDQMNLIINAGTATRNEIQELSGVLNWFISHTTSKPSMGQVDDSIIGTAELTRSDVHFDKYHAMLMYQNSIHVPDFDDVTTTISGRGCISKLLQDCPVNFSRTPTWYDSNKNGYIKYDPTEIAVKVNRGQLTQGVLDKSSIGKGASGGLYHIIANEYGARKALDVMFNMQQLAIGYIRQRGYTIGIMDLMVNPTAKHEIDCIASDIIMKSKLITEQLNNGQIIPPIGKTVEEFFEEQQISTLSIFDDFTEPILTSINPNINNLFKLIQFGSKGKIEQMFNMMSAIGQKLINGERIRQKFGFKRTLAYFPRFDTSPEARGYITNSYLAGMTSSEYAFNAMAARFDLISKALSTSVTGEQNRKSIKNLESIHINNYRWAVKDRNIIEFAYGEDFLDPRKVERVKFPTIMINDAEFNKYAHKDFPEFFAQMRKDRDEYRKVFMNIENINIKELMSADRFMPIDIARIINDILSENISHAQTPTDKEMKTMITHIDSLCNGIPYVLINEIQEKLGTKIPDYIRTATHLLCILIRSYLHPNALVNNKITPAILNLIVDKIRLRYAQALIEPGTAVGIIAAQSFSEPLTQYMLDAHHRSATGGTSKNAMKVAKEILAAQDISKLSNPTMFVSVLPEHETSKSKVQEIANNIEVMKLRQFVVSWQIFFEKYGEPVHSQYKHEKDLVAEFARTNPLLHPPNDLIKWCIRMVINKTTLILKNMSLDLIITKLREMFPNVLYIVHTPENAKTIVIRIYMRNIMFKGAIAVDSIKSVKDSVLDTIIRGVDGIINTTLVKKIRNQIGSDGGITRVDNAWAIMTTGINMRGVLTNKFIDKYKVMTNSVQETYRLFGIEAARQKIISGLRDLVDVCNHRHYLMYADEMTYTGKVTSIESSGLKTREASNVLLRIGFSSPLATLEEAAVNGMEDTVTGVTAPLLMGSIPKLGTLYNNFSVNREFIKNNVKRPDTLLDELL